jgi:hypothetical protein
MPAAGLEVGGGGIRIDERLDRRKRKLDRGDWGRLA